VQVFGAVAAAMGAPVERQTRSYMEDIFKCLSDNKPQVRAPTPHCAGLRYRRAENPKHKQCASLEWRPVGGATLCCWQPERGAPTLRFHSPDANVANDRAKHTHDTALPPQCALLKRSVNKAPVWLGRSVGTPTLSFSLSFLPTQPPLDHTVLTASFLPFQLSCYYFFNTRFIATASPPSLSTSQQQNSCTN
jgi:hypothetical protein